MVSIREFTFDILFNDRATKALKRSDKMMSRAKRTTDRLGRSSEKLERRQDSLKRSSMSLASGLKLLGGAAVGGLILNQMRKLGSESIALAIDFEQTEVSFGTLLGSMDKGLAMLKELEDFSLATPFQPEPIIASGRALLAAERPAGQILADLRRIGDVAAISKVPLQDLTRIFSKVFSKGRATLEELFPVAERGIPILSTLRDLMGVDTVEQVLDLASKGKITFDLFNKAFAVMTSKGGLFEDGMVRLSKTTGGLISTMMGFFDIVKRTFGKATLEPLKEVVVLLTEMAKATLEWLSVSENMESLKQTFRDIGFIIQKTFRFLAGIFEVFEAGRKTWIGQALLHAFNPAKFFRSSDAFSNLVLGRGELGNQGVVAGQAPGAAVGQGATPGKAVLVDKIIGSLTVHANGPEEGRAAAEAIIDVLDREADKLREQLAS